MENAAENIENIENADIENAKNEVRKISAPEALSADAYNNQIASLAFDSLSDEAILLMTGLSKEDPEFIEKLQQNEKAVKNLLDYQEEFLSSYLNRVDEFALDGKINKSYAMVLELADFSDDDYLFMTQTNTSPIDCLERRFKNFEEISDNLEFLEKVNFINSGQEVKNPSMFCKSLTNYENNLEDEQKAKLNMLCAQTLRASLVNVQGSLIMPVVSEYKAYLEKAINLSSEYDIIADSHRSIEALGPIRQTRLIKDAYKKVLNKAKKEKDNKVIYNTNKKLAEFYKDEYNIIGFKSDNSPQFKALLKAEKHYIDAISAYKKENKAYNTNDLREIAKIQGLIPNIEGWVETKTKLANSLQGTDKYKALISILPKMQKNQLEYVNMLSKKISRGNIVMGDKVKLITLLEKNSINALKRQDQRAVADKYIKEAREYLNAKKVIPSKKKER